MSDIVNVNSRPGSVPVVTRGGGGSGGTLYLGSGKLISSIVRDDWGIHELAYVDFQLNSESDTVFLRGLVHFDIADTESNSNHSIKFAIGPVFVTQDVDTYPAFNYIAYSVDQSNVLNPGLSRFVLPECLLAPGGLDSLGDPLPWQLEPGVTYRAYLTAETDSFVRTIRILNANAMAFVAEQGIHVRGTVS